MSKQSAIDNAVLRRVERNRAKKEAFMSNSFLNGSNVALPRAAGRDPIKGVNQDMADVIKIGNTQMKSTQKEPASDSINSGFNVSSQVVVGPTKSVDARDVNAQFGFGKASHPGDTRAPNTGDISKQSTWDAADNGGPRNPAGQFKNSRSDKGGSFQSTVDSTEVGG